MIAPLAARLASYGAQLRRVLAEARPGEPVYGVVCPARGLFVAVTYDYALTRGGGAFCPICGQRCAIDIATPKAATDHPPLLRYETLAEIDAAFGPDDDTSGRPRSRVWA